MAHAYRISASAVGFNLDESEEILLIASYLEAKRAANGAFTPWMKDFEENFFETDRGVHERMIRAINEFAADSKNKQLAISLRPSPRTGYMQTRGNLKTDCRIKYREIIEQHNNNAKQLVQTAQAKARMLPPVRGDEAHEQSDLFKQAEPRLSGATTLRIPPRLAIVASAASTTPPATDPEQVRRARQYFAGLVDQPRGMPLQDTVYDAPQAEVIPPPPPVHTAPPPPPPELMPVTAEVVTLLRSIADALGGIGDRLAKMEAQSIHLAPIAPKAEPVPPPTPPLGKPHYYSGPVPVFLTPRPRPTVEEQPIAAKVAVAAPKRVTPPPIVEAQPEQTALALAFAKLGDTAVIKKQVTVPNDPSKTGVFVRPLPVRWNPKAVPLDYEESDVSPRLAAEMVGVTHKQLEKMRNGEMGPKFTRVSACKVRYAVADLRQWVRHYQKQYGLPEMSKASRKPVQVQAAE